jgi:lysophospholipid acyltransferase (LPLAT)-like uncharacterized protein
MTEPAKSAQQPLENGEEQENSPAPGRHYDVHLAPLSPRRRLQVPVLGLAGYALIRAIGPTLRFEVLGAANLERVHASGRRAILAFWHRAIFSATWWWRGRGIVVLNSANFDGQWTRRVIERFGFATAQGSSSRGGLRGLAEMARRLEQNHDVAFTIDGPRGPRNVAKPGPAMLARRSGCPIIAFHIGVERARTLEKTWDLFQIPKLYSRAVVVIHPAIEVSQHADRGEVEAKHAEMQVALDRARELGESWFALSEAERERARAEWNT